MKYYIKFLKFHHKAEHSFWAYNALNKGMRYFNESDYSFNRFLQEVVTVEDSIVTTDGEYLVGKYYNDLNLNNIEPLDIMYYLQNNKKYSISDEQQKLGCNEFSFETTQSFAIISFDNFTYSSYFNKSFSFMEKFESTLLHASKTPFLSYQYKICQNVHHFNNTKLQFNISSENYDIGLNIIRSGGYFYPTYTSLAVISGRLGFHGKLNPMTINKKLRKDLLPINDKIVSYDVRNAEPNIFFTLAGEDFDMGDVYQHLGDVVFGDMDRDGIKKHVYYFMYDKNYVNTDLDHYLWKSNDYKRSIYNSVDKTSSIQNIFGRVLKFTEDEKQSVVNRYIQSSFSDLFQLTVNYMINRFSNLKSKILYTIHDELAIDIDMSEMEIIESIFTEVVNLYGFNIKFSIK